ncbi:MAG TPA: hypothetical protein VF103_03665 [Polyangiaceae bacterium]
MKAREVLGLATLALLSGGCEAVLGIDFDAVEPQNQKACGSALPNPPPDVMNAGGNVEIVVVTMDSRYGDGPDPSGDTGFYQVGYDLDGTCTGRGGKALCEPPEWTGSDVKDGPDGEDNGVGRMLMSQDDIFNLDLVTSDTLNAEIVRGNDAPTGIIRVRGYNGFHEDDTVEVDWFVPLAPASLGANGFVPVYDGSDVWPLATDDLDAPDTDGAPMSIYRDTHAYVSGYQLVAHFDRIRIPISNIYFEADGVIVSGDIVSRAREGTKLENGLLAGVVSSSTLLEVLPLTTEAITGQSLCSDDPLYPSIKKFVCISADSSLSGGRACDGSSFGIAFQTAGVTLGEQAPIVLPPSGCTPETLPRGDTCAFAAPEPTPE